MEIHDLYAIFCKHPSIQTDSRKVKPGDIFFALKGPFFNGNEYALQALDDGAAFAVIDESVGTATEKLITTENVLQTLQELAKYHRLQFNIPFLAITGSNGKTTTKELIHEVLSTTYKTYTTAGNLNNHIGIPLTILSVKKDAEIAVIEMGANHQKEIESYCAYTLPTHGLITNVGKAHLEGFGGIEGVQKGKGELYVFLKIHEGIIFRMNDYDYLKNMSADFDAGNIFTYGTHNATITGLAQNTSDDFLKVQMLDGTTIKNISTNLAGSYNLPNVLAAVAVGKYFKVPDEKIKIALENYFPSNSRSQMIEKNGNKIILDAYNANPMSMKAAIENLAGMEGQDKILLLGAMMELGSESIAEHTALIELIAKYPWKNVVLVGGDFNNITHPYIYLKNSLAAKEWLLQQHLQNAILLVKGSRSMQMEKVLE